MSSPKILLAMLMVSALLWGCGQALQRGMMDGAYISTARPAISLQARNLPLMTYGQNICNMTWTGVMGGLPIDVWLAVYGQGGLAPLAIVAQAQLPTYWYWDSQMARPFSVDEGTAVFDNSTYESWTYLVNPAHDPFSALVTTTLPDGQPQMWIARAFASRFNFNQDKIILEYREPLPGDITSLSQLPLGRDSFLREFAARAQQAFIVGAPPAGAKATRGYTNGVLWQYMDQNFLGTVSQQEPLAWD